MNRSRALAEPTPVQTIHFSDVPEDIVQNVQVVQSQAAPAGKTSAADTQVFFSEVPPDITQAVQVVATASALSKAAIAGDASSDSAFQMASLTTASKLNALTDWKNLLLFKAPDDITSYLKSRNMQIQYAHNESYSNDLNTDLYPVRIDRFPVHNGNMLTPETLIKYIRANINSLIDTSISAFHPYDTSIDAPVWDSDNPLKAVLRINIFPDNASVVVSSATPTGWTFTTITTPDTGHHPVSGHRNFFMARRASVDYFVNKGLDMTSSGIAGIGLPLAGEYGYGKADELWMSLQNKLVEFINTNGGEAKKEKRYSERVEWRFVYQRYKAALESVFGAGAGSPSNSPFFDIF